MATSLEELTRNLGMEITDLMDDQNTYSHSSAGLQGHLSNSPNQSEKEKSTVIQTKLFERK